jgi:hypothetical protein
VFALVIFAGCIVSIHAPAWGRRQHTPATIRHGQCFNPRPRVGGDDTALLNQLTKMQFQGEDEAHQGVHGRGCPSGPPSSSTKAPRAPWRRRARAHPSPQFHLHSIAHAALQASGRAICCSSTKVISR